MALNEINLEECVRKDVLMSEPLRTQARQLGINVKHLSELGDRTFVDVFRLFYPDTTSAISNIRDLAKMARDGSSVKGFLTHTVENAERENAYNAQRRKIDWLFDLVHNDRPVSEVEAYLAANSDVDIRIARTQNGATLLTQAAGEKRKALMEFFLDKGLDINDFSGCDNERMPAHNGSNALTYHAGKGDRNMVDYLLELGADVNARNKLGQDALGAALGANQMELAEQLFGKGAIITERHLIDAAGDCNADALGFLAAKNADFGAPRIAQVGNKTLAHLAANAGKPQEDTVRALSIILRKAPELANIATTDDGFLPLHYAASRMNPQATKLLLEKTQNPNTPGSNGDTPLHRAASGLSCRINIGVLLADERVDPTIANKAGKTAEATAEEVSLGDYYRDQLATRGQGASGAATLRITAGKGSSGGVNMR